MSNLKFCPGCGAELVPGDRFCGSAVSIPNQRPGIRLPVHPPARTGGPAAGQNLLAPCQHVLHPRQRNADLPGQRAWVRVLPGKLAGRRGRQQCPDDIDRHSGVLSSAAEEFTGGYPGRRTWARHRLQPGRWAGRRLQAATRPRWRSRPQPGRHLSVGTGF